MDSDTSKDKRANYDFSGGEISRPQMVDDLRELVEGEIRFDTYSRELYATDASIYEVTPIGVVFPHSTADVSSAVKYCTENDIPILPRGGGTSLAGQAVNEAVILDFTRHMNELISVQPDAKRTIAQPGIYLDTINNSVNEFGLKFAPDPAWSDKSTLGGAIGNNSTGAHSLKYGKTDAYIESCEVVLADGTITTFGEISIETLERRANPNGHLEARIYDEVKRIINEETSDIEAKYPSLKRNVSGYNLDNLISEAQSGTVNLARLLAGSEGTLAIVTQAEIALEPIPESKSMALLAYRDLIDAMKDVESILEHDPAAIEVLDDVLIDLARDTEKFEDVVSILPKEARAVLLVEFYAEDDISGESKVSDLIFERTQGVATKRPPSDSIRDDSECFAFDALEAHTEPERKRFWKLRKSGLPILLGKTSDAKHIAFVEDTAIPPQHLPEYITEFRDILDDYDTYASFYAHAGPGVLHIRPLVNLKTSEGIQRMSSIAEEVTDLVLKYGGSVSGEHGDGRSRTQWNRKLYGDNLWQTFRNLKQAFDPELLLNPGQVCGDIEMTDNLRFGTEYDFNPEFNPTLNWDNENGFQGMVELCHGCGGCRGLQDTTGDVMCPTYRASQEEITSTRGRANLLRQVLAGELNDDLADLEFMNEVMELCIGCKGCARDCPSEVDMAKLKAEVTHHYHTRNGATIRDHIFVNIDQLMSLGSTFAPISNWVSRVPGSRWIIEKTLGIDKNRTLPAFKRQSFTDWFEKRESRGKLNESASKAVLIADPMTNYSTPRIGKAAVQLLEASNVRVQLAPINDVGRPAYSKGFLNKASDRAAQVVTEFIPLIEEGWDIVAIEPSDAVMLQSDYPDLLSGPNVQTVAEGSYGFCEYMDINNINPGYTALNERLTYHGHCHQKAMNRDWHTVNVLREAGYQVDYLDSGCCGMAGSFGYEAEHASMSEAIGNILFRQIEKSDGDQVVAPGTSCRAQISEYMNLKTTHPIEKLNNALSNQT